MRFEDAGPENSGRPWVPPVPCGVSTPFGRSCSGPRPEPKLRAGPPCAFAPLQRHASAAPHGSVASPTRFRAGRPVPPCCLSWASVPYDTVPDRRTRLVATDPSAAACHVRGLATSFAASTADPPGARSAGASMGLPLQGVLLAASGAPLGVPALLTLPSAASPGGDGRDGPPSGPCSRDELVLSPDPRRNPTVDAFLRFSPSELSLHPSGLPLVVTAPALSTSGGVTSLPSWSSGLRETDGSAWTVSGLPALMGFHTF